MDWSTITFIAAWHLTAALVAATPALWLILRRRLRLGALVLAATTLPILIVLVLDVHFLWTSLRDFPDRPPYGGLPILPVLTAGWAVASVVLATLVGLAAKTIRRR